MSQKTPLTSFDEPVETALAALATGLASIEDLSDAVAARRAQRPTIGQLLLTSHKLTVHQVFQVLSEQATSSKLFGEIAIERGFLRQSDLDEMLHLQLSLCPPLREVLVTRNVLTPAQADSIQHTIQSRLRQPTQMVPVTCEA